MRSAANPRARLSAGEAVLDKRRSAQGEMYYRDGDEWDAHSVAPKTRVVEQFGSPSAVPIAPGSIGTVFNI